MSSSLHDLEHKEELVRILVVDDQPQFLRLFKRIFSKTGYDIVTAEGGDFALEILERGERFNLLVLDVMMPVKSGYEVCREVRKQFNLFELPILFLTARRETEDVLKGFDAGGNDYVSKPFEAPELLSRTQTLIKLNKLYNINNELQLALNEKNKFLAMNIHDLKNPLSSIMVMTEILKKEAENESRLQTISNIEIINSSAMFMSGLVQQILDFAAMEDEGFKLKKELVDVNMIMSQVIDVNKHIAEQKKQTIKFVKGPENKCIILSDPDRMIQAFNNLVSNAIKYSPAQKTIYTNIVLKEYDNEGLFVRLEVEDEGPGFSEEDKLKIFNVFTPLSAKPTGGESSTGLGLVIAKELIEMSGGRIWLDNSNGIGSKFIVEIPAK